jgi:hypothetical protein
MCIGFDIVAAPLIGIISRFVPSYYYYTNNNSLSHGQNNSNNNGLVGTAEATTTSNYKNGIRYVHPLSSFKFTYSNETWTFTKNFRSDGSMRSDFKDRFRKSVFVTGYFKVVKRPDSEEVSAKKLNGGPHTSSSPENTYADTMDLSIQTF